MFSSFSAKGGRKAPVQQFAQQGEAAQGSIAAGPRGPSEWAPHLPHLGGVATAAATERTALTTAAGRAYSATYAGVAKMVLQRFAAIVTAAKQSPDFYDGNQEGNGTGLNPALGILLAPQSEMGYLCPSNAPAGAPILAEDTLSKVKDAAARSFSANYQLVTNKPIQEGEMMLIDSFRKGIVNIVDNNLDDLPSRVSAMLRENVCFHVPLANSSSNALLLPFALGISNPEEEPNATALLFAAGRVFIRSTGMTRSGKLQTGMVHRAVDGQSLKTSIDGQLSNGHTINVAELPKDAKYPSAAEVVAGILMAGGVESPTIGQARVIVRLAQYDVGAKPQQAGARVQVVRALSNLDGKMASEGVAAYMYSVIADLGMNQATFASGMMDWLNKLGRDVDALAGADDIAKEYATLKGNTAARSGYKNSPDKASRPRVSHASKGEAEKAMNVKNGRGTGSKAATTGLFQPTQKRHATQSGPATMLYGSKPSQKTYFNKDMQSAEMGDVIGAYSSTSGLTAAEVMKSLTEAGKKQVLRRIGELFAISLVEPELLTADGQLRATGDQKLAYARNPNKADEAVVLDGVYRVYTRVDSSSMPDALRRTILQNILQNVGYFFAMRGQAVQEQGVLQKLAGYRRGGAAAAGAGGAGGAIMQE